MAELRDWSIAAVLNNEVAPDGFPEGMDFRDVNDAAREVMAVLARRSADTSGVLVTAGTAADLTLVVNGTYSTFSDGDRFSFTLHVAIEAAANLRVGPAVNSSYPLISGGAPLGAILDVVFLDSEWMVVQRPINVANGVAGLDSDGRLTATQLPSAVSGTFAVGTIAENGPSLVNGTVTVAHGLGAAPSFVTCHVVCVLDQHGYATGDLAFPVDSRGSGISGLETGLSASADATNVSVTVKNNIRIPRQSNGQSSTLSTANWKAVATPYLLR